MGGLQCAPRYTQGPHRRVLMISKSHNGHPSVVRFEVNLSTQITLTLTLTLDKISIDLSGVNKQKNGLLYVALSRVRSIKDMVLKKVPRKNFDKFLRIGKLTASVHDCLNEIERIQKKSIIKSIDNYNQTETYINNTEEES